jgi:very-short-patch-repair endonuclease
MGRTHQSACFCRVQKNYAYWILWELQFAHWSGGKLKHDLASVFKWIKFRLSVRTYPSVSRWRDCHLPVTGRFLVSASKIPPRNGEGDRAKRGGGVLAASDAAFKLAKRERRSGNLPEVLIWRELRKRPGGYKFRRQHPLSELVLDFVCLECRLAIEIDGEAHNRGDNPDRDNRRDAYLAARGFRVLRLPARLVLQDMRAAIETIVAACDNDLPHHHSALPSGPPPRFGEVFGTMP